MTLDSPLTEIKGVGAELAKKYAILGISSVYDLINYYPKRYEDYSHTMPINRIKPGAVTVKGVIKQTSGRYVRRGMHITEAVISDETGSVRLVWFNQPYRAAALKADTEYFVSGDFQLSHQRMSIMNPSAELASSFPINTARIVPVYKETKGLKSAQIRKAISAVLPLISTLPETMPGWICQQQNLVPYAQAVQQMHFPDSGQSLQDATRRLGFEEVFGLTLAALLNKQDIKSAQAVKISFNKQLAKQFVAGLPFTLTDAQRKTIWQIYKDLESTQPMNRLVEGDVGSGKTVVAVMAALMAIKQGFQVALMAPTEILARQHADAIYELLKPVGMQNTVGLLIGGLSAAKKTAIQKSVASGDVRFIVGTHAIIKEKVNVADLGLIIIDEQDRFGVEERKKLQAKAGHAVHILNMTATPIPRSLALTLFGEMDISLIDAMPQGRKRIITKICSPNSRTQLNQKIEQQLAAGRQMFVVTPLITDSDFLSARSAEEVYKDLSTKAFKHRRVGLLHGKMKPEEKDKIMQSFVNHKLDILVSTTVIEVGVNVPNATVMLIENAERFGLAQIHQLRGRVGRSGYQGYAYLMLGDSSAPSKRLRALEGSSNGFELAELDLEIRGPGAIYGTLQHGQLDLRVAKLTDVALIAAARSAAHEFIDKNEKLVKYKQLESRVQKLRAVTSLN